MVVGGLRARSCDESTCTSGSVAAGPRPTRGRCVEHVGSRNWRGSLVLVYISLDCVSL